MKQKSLWINCEAWSSISSAVSKPKVQIQKNFMAKGNTNCVSIGKILFCLKEKTL